MKTFVPGDLGENRRWLVVDAADKPLGRLATKIADALRGKDTPVFTPHVDTGAFVVVVNAEKVRLSGRKDRQKHYRRYTGYRGGLRETAVDMMRTRHPERIIKLAVRGMLPKNHLARKMIARLKVYAGEDHPHAAQKPEAAE